MKSMHCLFEVQYEGKPYTATHPPPLPEFRVRERPPFTYTGMDFASPLHVKERATMEQVRFGSASTHVVWCKLYI